MPIGSMVTAARGGQVAFIEESNSDEDSDIGNTNVVVGVPPDFFFALSFDRQYPQGTFTFYEGFKAEGQSAKQDGR